MSDRQSTRIDAGAYRRNIAMAAPFILVLPVVMAAVVHTLGEPLHPWLMLAGAGGWLFALALRSPVALLAMRFKRSPDAAKQWVVLASGPCEELIRLLLLMLLRPAFSGVISLGLGWAAIEVVYALVCSVLMASMLDRNDPKGEEIRAFIASMPMMSPRAPWWGILERVWASLLHVGFTLLIGSNSLLVVPAAVAHSFTNVAVLRYAERSRSPAQMSLLGLLWSALIVTAGLWMWR